MQNDNGKKLAVTSLTLGVVGLWFLGVFTAIPGIICGHKAKKKATAVSDVTVKGLSSAGLVLSYLALIITIFTGSLGIFGANLWGSKSSVLASDPIITGEALKQELQAIYNSTRDGKFMPQAFFDGIHPIGTASKIQVHDVSIVWKHGRPSSKYEDILSWTCRMTIYWSAILVDKGYTKLELTYDNEVGDFTKNEILATNGQTTEDIAFGIGWMIGAALASDY